MEELRKIIVCGATGSQGGAVLDALNSSGQWQPIAITRNPDSPAAQAIKKKNIPVIKADLNDKAALVEAFRSAYGVFGVTNPIKPNGKVVVEDDWIQGQNIVHACIQNDIKHLVLSTVVHIDSAQRATLIETKRKYDLEDLVEESQTPFTILMPASFMDNLGKTFMPVKKNTITGLAKNEAKVAWISCRDIGLFAKMAFNQPEKFVGKKLNLIGDFISGNEIALLASQQSRTKTYQYKTNPEWLMWIFAKPWLNLRKHFEKWSESPTHSNIILEAQKECKEMLPELLSFKQYLEWIGWGK
jgi:uncharacterized protein YbjT (DUF2867 family)